MESTAQYWKLAWMVLERRFRLLLAQARSNPAPSGAQLRAAIGSTLLRSPDSNLVQ